jgi:hypothetical protein
MSNFWLMAGFCISALRNFLLLTRLLSSSSGCTIIPKIVKRTGLIASTTLWPR